MITYTQILSIVRLVSGFKHVVSLEFPDGLSLLILRFPILSSEEFSDLLLLLKSLELVASISCFDSLVVLRLRSFKVED